MTVLSDGLLFMFARGAMACSVIWATSAYSVALRQRLYSVPGADI